MIRSDSPNGFKKRVVCVHYKEHIPLIRRDNLCTLNHCLVAEICLENKKCFLICLYRSPSQHEFENFCTNLDFLIDDINNELPIVSIITGDFNARCSIKILPIQLANSYRKQLFFLHQSYIL